MLVSEREYIKDSLYDVFKEIIGEKYELIFEHENGRRPIPPFFSLDFSTIKLLGTTPYYYPSLVEKDDKLIFLSKQPVERWAMSLCDWQSQTYTSRGHTGAELSCLAR